MYKCLHNLAPSYLASAAVPVSETAGRSNLRSATRGDLVTPSAKTNYGFRSFAVAAPRLWNSLPIDIRDRSLSLDLFTITLKTLYFLLSN